MQPDRTAELTSLLQQRLLILDGAMGTMIQRHKLQEADYRGARFADHPFDLKGNNDLLLLTKPEVIRGIHAEYLAAATQAYRDGSRSDETMKALVAALDVEVIRDISAFYANQQPQQPNVRKPLTIQEWAQRCDRCHGVNGNSTNPRFPALAAQHAEYLEKVLKAYRTRARRSPEMAAMSDGLSDEETKHLAAHYARQKARAVIFVPLPSK